MPTPNVYRLHPDNAFAAVPAAFQTNVVDLLYVTDRRPEFNKRGWMTYSTARSESLAFGSAMVGIGDGVDWPTLVKDSVSRKRSAKHRLRVRELRELDRFPPTPYPLTGAEGGRRVDPVVQEEEDRVNRAFLDELKRRLDQTPRHEVYLFVHGFNNEFDDVATLLAEIWHFLQREGVAILYTWPAGAGGLRGYTRDRESGEFTVHHLKQCLRLLLDAPGVEKIHLLAHSRGTDVLTTALREVMLERQGRNDVFKPLDRVANLILIAPDLDVDVSSQRIAAEHLEEAVGRMTVYSCQEDKAITLANWLFEGARRLGTLLPTQLSAQQRALIASIPNLTFIDARIKAGFLSHGYFHSSPAASSDLLLLLRENCDPGTRDCRPLEHVEGGFWALGKDYPGSGER